MPRKEEETAENGKTLQICPAKIRWSDLVVKIVVIVLVKLV